MSRSGARSLLRILTLVLAAGCRSAEVTVTVHADSTYQTIVGWEAHSQSGESEVPEFPQYADRLFDLAVDSLGITRLRLEVSSGMEHGRDHWSEWRRGDLSDEVWRCVRYATEDDDGDPNHIALAGFHFAALDHTIEQVVLPLKRRLEARGERLYLNVTYVAFARQCAETPYHHLDVDEYAEFALAVHRHLREAYGLVPDAWEMILEPEHTDWTGRAIGEAMVRTSSVLAREGFGPEFIAPSNTSMANAIAYFDEMIAVPGVSALLDELSYHRYRIPTERQARSIADRAARYGLRTAMLEHIGSGHEDLYEDLVVAQVSAWQQFTLAYRAAGDGTDEGGAYFLVDVRVDPPRIRWGTRTRMLRQYFRYVRPGAIRLGATVDGGRAAATAFRNTDGRLAVVVNVEREGMLRVVSLPAGEYGTTFATGNAFFELGTFVMTAGDTLRVRLPERGVATIFSR